MSDAMAWFKKIVYFLNKTCIYKEQIRMNVTMHTFSINADPLAVCLSVTGITTIMAR